MRPCPLPPVKYMVLYNPLSKHKTQCANVGHQFWACLPKCLNVLLSC
jgi:hypothetical protein